MASFWLAVAVQIAISPLSSPPIIRATMEGTYVYSSGVNGKRTGIYYAACGGTELSILRLNVGQENPITVLNHRVGFYGDSTALLRWQIIDKRYYSVSYGAQSKNEAVYRAGYVNSVPLAAIEALNGIDNAPDFHERILKYESQFDKYGTSLSPVGTAVFWRDESIARWIFFDFWCRGDKQYEVYVTEPHKGKRLTREDFHPERKIREDQSPQLLWDQVGEWTFDWAGPFYVAATGDERYFVTDTGRVFLAPRAAKPGTPLKELWKGPSVDVLIHDGDAATWYAFTKEQFFEIADPIKSMPHTVPIRRAWTANEALETAAKCGRMIRSRLAPPMSERTWDDLASPVRRVGLQCRLGDVE
jgi:hypothetical protein